MGIAQSMDEDKGKQQRPTRKPAANALKPVNENEIKVLLLGPGDTGKSTVFKQLMIIYDSGFSDEFINKYTHFVRGNTLHAMRSLIAGCVHLDIELEPKNAATATRLDEDYDESSYLRMASLWTPELASDIATLWKDPGIQEAFARRSEFQCIENVRFYFDNLDRISANDYTPSHEDILMTRVKTIGAVMKDIPLGNNVQMKLVDVGGQRNERRKWTNFFEGVEVVIFLVAASEYNQVLYEDDTTNRMQENLDLFADTINNTYFINKPVILVLNKMDVFREKIKTYDFKLAFPDYEGGQDAEIAIDFLKDKYEKKRKTSAPFYCLETQAVDTEQLQETFDEIKRIILELVEEKKKVAK